MRGLFHNRYEPLLAFDSIVAVAPSQERTEGISSSEEKLAAGLPYGFRKLLEVARALLSEPAILLMDEPAAGMNDREKVEIAEIIKDIRDDLGVSVLLVEHDMNLVMGIADRITVLDSGHVIATGDAEHVQNHPKVIEAYLGTEEL